MSIMLRKKVSHIRSMRANLKVVGHTGQEIFIHVPLDFTQVLDMPEKWESTV